MNCIQNYQKSIDLIKDEGLIPEKFKNEVEVHDFRQLPNEDLLQNLFNFFQSSIIHHYKHGIQPGLFFFNTNKSLNAFAARWKDHFLISFNMGTLNFLKERFLDQSSITDGDGLEDYKAAGYKSDLPLNELMFQLCNNYIFYHELGHLIQKSDRLYGMMNEDIMRKPSFNIHDHVLEYDADLFSSICLGTHLYQYIVKYCPDVSDKEAELIISFVSASVFLLLLSFNSSKKDLYFKKNSHPHPIIRIIGILYVITDYIELLSRKERAIHLNKNKMAKNVIYVAEKIADRVLVGPENINIMGIFEDNLKSISKYNGKLQKLVKQYPMSAFNRRNEQLKK